MSTFDCCYMFANVVLFLCERKIDFKIDGISNFGKLLLKFAFDSSFKSIKNR